jgi:hypothetical protein
MRLGRQSCFTVFLGREAVSESSGRIPDISELDALQTLNHSTNFSHESRERKTLIVLTVSFQFSYLLGMTESLL